MLCKNCGRDITPLDNRRRKFCSKECCDSFHKKKYKNEDFKPYIEPEFICPHNEGISCLCKNCSTCGWNPEVAQKRMEAYSG